MFLSTYFGQSSADFLYSEHAEQCSKDKYLHQPLEVNTYPMAQQINHQYIHSQLQNTSPQVTFLALYFPLQLSQPPPCLLAHCKLPLNLFLQFI